MLLRYITFIIMLKVVIMERKVGRVIEVFIPEEDNLDDMNIGFKVLVDDDVIEIIEEQNEFNINILKDDLVMITKQVISNKEFIDIELYDGDLNE